ncbi:hypothetical protein RM697_03465 [Ichthyenterobacterium sp. W332]|uniref:Lipoprotein n=1 Tax=Microcosmobacter mediterraneus TaxID=3075607 RepID=A0ABU2YHR4_9FLAO|nr:hypothetical protein [Ichthyenterobacterium sp. W332]MDT0557688.1 hypothetical protein [Ichthyenterobacterium sp. W332]
MKSYTILGYVLLMFLCSCLKYSPSKVQDSNVINGYNLKSGLLINNGINRGLAFTDSLQNTYAITYISVTISNDSTIPIQFSTNFNLDYDHPLKESDDKFKVVILPEQWTFDGFEITDSMINDIYRRHKQPKLQQILKPNETFRFAIGTLRPSPAKICGIIPNAFFINDTTENFKHCNWLKQNHNTSKTPLLIGLKLDYCHNNGNVPNCMLLHCGTMSYPKK